MLRLHRDGVHAVRDLSVNAAAGVRVGTEHALVHVPVLDQDHQLVRAQLAADVGDHAEQFGLGQHALPVALRQRADGLHRVDQRIRRFGGGDHVRGVNAQHLGKPFDLPGGPLRAFLDLGGRVAHDVEEDGAQGGRGLGAAPLGDRGDGAKRGGQLVDPDVSGGGNGRHLADTGGDLAHVRGVLVADLVRAVHGGGQRLHAALHVVRLVHGGHVLVRHVRGHVARALQLDAQFGKALGLLPVTGARELGHALQIIGRGDAVFLRHIEGILCHALQFLARFPGNAPHDYQLIVDILDFLIRALQPIDKRVPHHVAQAVHRAFENASLGVHVGERVVGVLRSARGTADVDIVGLLLKVVQLLLELCQRRRHVVYGSDRNRRSCQIFFPPR